MGMSRCAVIFAGFGCGSKRAVTQETSVNHDAATEFRKPQEPGFVSLSAPGLMAGRMQGSMTVFMRLSSLQALLTAVLVLGTVWAAPSTSPAGSRPDIVVILADDMGFSDLGCFGGEIRTPHLDQLAAKGLRFTQFYNASRCCPTRASLMTGQYPHKVGLARNGRSLTFNGLTMAEALKLAGYQTAMSGKWHLSLTPVLDDGGLHQRWLDHRYDPGRPFGPLETYPARRGFDQHYGVIWGVVDYFDPFSLVDGVEPVRRVPKDYYITDALTDKAVEYVETFAKVDRPFFLYLAYTAPHWPLHARPEDIARYRDRYRAGWHALRAERRKRQLALGLYEPGNTPLPKLMGNGPDWEALTEDQRAFESAKMAVHAAMVDRLDQGVGRVVDSLKAAGRFENTLILFLSDNGASPEIVDVPGYDRTSATRDGRPVRYSGMSPDELGSQTTYTMIGSWWANAANTPFRYWKAESFEGGNHTPAIVHWPAGLRVRPGSITPQVGHVIDILPTCLEVARVEYPSTYQGRSLTALDGLSLLPILQGRERAGHEALFFEHENGRALRVGDWKLVSVRRREAEWELYDLAKDRTETRNLARVEPERVQSMQQQWKAWFDEVMAVGREQETDGSPP